MADLLGIGISGLQSFKTQLDTTSHNIANVNTEGYSRQRVGLAARTPQFSGFGFTGNGVGVDGIQRITDEFLTSQVLSNTTSLTQLDAFHSLATRVDALVANAEVGLTPAIQSFFNSAQDVADDPSSIPARQVFLAEANTLVDRFKNIDTQLSTMARQTNGVVTNSLDQINSLAEGIASLNRTIVNTPTDQSEPPNDLLDQRDELIRRVAELIDVQLVAQDNGALNVFIGNGQALVTDITARTLNAQINTFDPQQLDVFVSDGTTTVNISGQLTGGSLGGSLDFVNDMLNPARNALGRVAVAMADTFNQQHRLGQDLDGAFGGDFFTPLNSGLFSPEVLDSDQNSISGFNALTAEYVDVSQLTTSNYQVRASGGNQYEVLRLDDNAIFNFNVLPGGSFNIDGLQVNVVTAPTNGDAFLIRPTFQAASVMSLAISEPRAVAAAVPMRSEELLSNTGNAAITQAAVTDATTFIPGDYRVVMGDDTGAVADAGATRGLFTDAGGADALSYTLSINGNVVFTQLEADAPLADLDALAAQINASVGTTGVRAYTDNTNLYLANDPPTALPINVEESLLGAGDAGDDFSGYFNLGPLTGPTAPAPSSSVFTTSFASPADSYVVLDSTSTVVTNGAYAATGTTVSFNGIEATLNGAANLGDQFLVERNLGGEGDNRNLLALVALQRQDILDNGTATYLDAYGTLVADVGSKTQQAGITRDAQQILVEQATAAREAVSGVNLDEEAANLIRFQQAYQAAAQVITTANDLFQTLISAVGR